MFKIGQKVRVMKKSEYSDGFDEVGQGVCRGVYQNNIGSPIFIKYTDKKWPVDITEDLAIDAENIKVMKF